MSRAFIKETDLEHAGIDIPERPISQEKNYVTPAGLEDLKNTLKILDMQRQSFTGGNDSNINQKKNPVLMKRFEVEPLLKSADIWRLESHFDDVRQFLRKIIDNLAILIKPCQGGPIGRRDIIG